MPVFKLYFFGTPCIERDGARVLVERRKSMALLATLAVSQQRLSREWLVALLWPNSRQQAARANLRYALTELRKTLDPALFAADRDTIELRGDAQLWVDVLEFRQLLKRTTVPAESGASTPLSEKISAAVSLYTYDFLGSFSLPDCPDFDAWQREQSTSLNRDVLAALSILVRETVDLGDFQTAIRYAHRWLELDPYQEPAYRALMQIHAWSGDVAAALREFERCQHLLHHELDIMPSPETRSLHDQIVSGRLESPLRPPAQAVPKQAAAHSLPIPATPFVGRQGELAQIDAMLADDTCRLLTIVGPGGVGKTRLAIEIGTTQRGVFQDGIYFVGLASLQRDELLAATLLEAINLSGSTPASPEEVVLHYLRRRHVLLILDNFEHLRGAIELVGKILANTAYVKLLVTSRERLHLHGEWLFPLQGLEAPPAAADRVLSNYPAVQLFVQCARRVLPGFSLTAETSLDAARLCRVVEGFPLAIELASTWLRIMPCNEIADAAQRGLDVLTAPASNIPQRHRSMRAALDHSWLLLSEQEQAVLCQLSLFRGGFRSHAAHSVAGASPAMLLALADKSWVFAGTDGRLHMHELVRQYCEERLQSATVAPATVQQTHAVYFGNFLQNQEEQLHGSGQVEAMRAILNEIDNLRAGWDWAVDHALAQLIDQFLESLYLVALLRGWYEEMNAKFHQAGAVLEQRLKAGEQLDGEPSTAEIAYVLARLLARNAYLQQRAGNLTYGLELCKQSHAYFSLADRNDKWIRERGYVTAIQAHMQSERGEWDNSMAFCDRALADFHAAQDLYGAAWIQWRKAFNVAAQGQIKPSIALYEQVDHQFEQIGEYYWRSMSLNCLAFSYRVSGEIAHARKASETSLALRKALDDRRGVALCLTELGLIALHEGDHQEAERLCTQSLDTAYILNDYHVHNFSRIGLGWAAYLRRDWAAAYQFFTKCLEISQNTRGKMWQTFAQLNLGHVAVAQQDQALASHHLGAALDLANEIGDHLAIVDICGCIAQICFQTGHTQAAVQLCAFARQYPETRSPARDDLVLLAQLQRSMEPHLFQEAVACGEQMQRDEAVHFARQQLRANAG